MESASPWLPHGWLLGTCLQAQVLILEHHELRDHLLSPRCPVADSTTALSLPCSQFSVSESSSVDKETFEEIAFQVLPFCLHLACNSTQDCMTSSCYTGSLDYNYASTGTFYILPGSRFFIRGFGLPNSPRKLLSMQRFLYKTKQRLICFTEKQ